jgi:hypothetical protein
MLTRSCLVFLEGASSMSACIHCLPLRGVFKGSETDLHQRFELFSAKHRPSGFKEEKELSQGLREHLIAKLGKKLAELYLKETT